MIVVPLDIYTLSSKSITKKKDILFEGRSISLLPVQVIAIGAYRKSTPRDRKCNETIYRAQSAMKLSPQASYQSYETIAMKRIALSHLDKRPSLNSISERTL
jgi:hypothetical protein